MRVTLCLLARSNDDIFDLALLVRHESLQHLSLAQVPHLFLEDHALSTKRQSATASGLGIIGLPRE